MNHACKALAHLDWCCLWWGWWQGGGQAMATAAAEVGRGCVCWQARAGPEGVVSLGKEEMIEGCGCSSGR